MLNFNQNQSRIFEQRSLKNLVMMILHFFLLAFVVYSVLMLLSVILPMVFEWLYALSTQLFSLMVPVSILISSLLVIVLPNPIYSLIALIFVFLNTAIFLLSIKVQFLALIYLIVYIGAIAILFLFVIMLFNLRSLQKSDLKIKDFSFLTISFKFYFFFGVKFFGILALEIWNLVEYSTYFNKEAVYHQLDLQYFLSYVHWDILLFSNLFYTYYSYIFLLSGLVLLAAMIGSIVLALSTTEHFDMTLNAQNINSSKISTSKNSLDPISRESSFAEEISEESAGQEALRFDPESDLRLKSQYFEIDSEPNLTHVKTNQEMRQVSKSLMDIRQNGLILSYFRDLINLFRFIDRKKRIDSKMRFRLRHVIVYEFSDVESYAILVVHHIDDFLDRRDPPLLDRLRKMHPKEFTPIENAAGFFEIKMTEKLREILSCSAMKLKIIEGYIFDDRNKTISKGWCWRYFNADGSYTDGVVHIYEQFPSDHSPDPQVYIELSPENRKKAGWPVEEWNCWIDPYIRRSVRLDVAIRKKWKAC